MAFAPAGVNQKQNYQYKDAHAGIENQIRKIGGGKTQIHDGILSIRNDAHQLATVITNPNSITQAGGLSTMNKYGNTSVATETWPRLSNIFENRLSWFLVNSGRLKYPSRLKR